MVGTFAIFTVVATFAVCLLLRYVAESFWMKRMGRAEKRSRDNVIASLRLRLPPGAEFVTLEHQMYFRDERNRLAAKEVFTNNGFEVSTAETYEKESRYWLLAVRSTLIDRVSDELRRVLQFAQSFGGRYDVCNPRL